MSLHRLYFDESGDHTDHALDTPKRRYLALCGLIFEVGAYRQFQEAFDQLKRELFQADPDEPVVLHREDILNRRGVFKRLQNETFRASFDDRLLALLRDSLFTGLVVVVDKKAHLERVKSSLHPYHYCLAALLERYCEWLAGRRGDVMGESRGRREDTQLQAAYRAIYEGGTLLVAASSFQQSLSSRDLKLKPKDKNVAGLQLADLLAHPARRRCLINHGVPDVQEGVFGRLLADILWQKLRKRADGETKGWGEVFLG
jgi:hypothetical protein